VKIFDINVYANNENHITLVQGDEDFTSMIEVSAYQIDLLIQLLKEEKEVAEANIMVESLKDE